MRHHGQRQAGSVSAVAAQSVASDGAPYEASQSPWIRTVAESTRWPYHSRRASVFVGIPFHSSIATSVSGSRRAFTFEVTTSRTRIGGELRPEGSAAACPSVAATAWSPIPAARRRLPPDAADRERQRHHPVIWIAVSASSVPLLLFFTLDPNSRATERCTPRPVRHAVVHELVHLRVRRIHAATSASNAARRRRERELRVGEPRRARRSTVIGGAARARRSATMAQEHGQRRSRRSAPNVPLRHSAEESEE